MAFDDGRKIDPLDAGQHAQNRGHEDELPDLYTGVEGEQRERNIARRQADLRERPGNYGDTSPFPMTEIIVTSV